MDDEQYPILSLLKEANVLDTPALTDGEPFGVDCYDDETRIDGLILWEGCDSYYWRTLTKEQVYQLAEEFKSLADSMP